MITNASITLYHYDDDGILESETEFAKANVYGKRATQSDANGRKERSNFSVRIPAAEKINISCGDKVYSEIFGKKLTVVGFSDNRRGSRRLWHYLIELGY